MKMPNKSAIISQAILLGFSLVFLCLTILCYSYYLKDDVVGTTLFYSLPGGLPNMPGGFAIASAISMLGFAIIEANKPLN